MTGMDGVNVFSFPCGHCVCNECDDKLQARAFYSCPTCREPRAGYNREDVDAAASARVQRDQLNEHVENDGQHVATTTLEHNGNFYHVVFLRDESSTSRPYDVLRTVNSNGVIEEGDAVEAAGSHPQVLDLPNNPEDAHTSGRNNLVSLSGPLAEMLRGLVQPNDMASFVQRHDALSTQLTARNARPRFL